MEVKHIGYATVVSRLDIGAGETLTVQVVLGDLPVQLPEVTVTGAAPAPPYSAVFMRGKVHGGGFFLTGAESSNCSAMFTDLLRRAPGIRLVPIRVRPEQLCGVSDRTAEHDPVDALYIDGIPVPVVGTSVSTIWFRQ